MSKPWADILAQLIQAGLDRREGNSREGGGQLVCALAAMVMGHRADVAGLLHAIEGACDLILYATCLLNVSWMQRSCNKDALYDN